MKQSNFLSGVKGRVAVGTALVLGSASAFSAPSTDWSSLTDAIDFGTMSVGLLAAGAALVGVYLVIKGVRIIVGMVRS